MSESGRAATMVDLFCGAGGLSLGFRHAGFHVIHAADHWGAAVATYRQNLGNHVHQVEIAEDIDIPQSTVIAGGPPCQGFSSAGRRLDDDKRNSLVAVFARIVVRMRPEAFVFENVEGFFTSADGRFVIELLGPLVEAGYRIHIRKINAANHGVPQHRKRVVAVGGLGWDPTFIEPTHTAHGAPGAHLAARTLPLAPSVLQALEGLPPPSELEPGIPPDHVAKPLEGIDLERAKSLKPGQRMRDLPEQLWHESYRRRAFRRVMDGTPTERRGGAPSGMRRLAPDEPSKAITGGAIRDFLHPLEDRSLTIRECARLQTFPDDCVFCGSKADRMLLVGNGVPPLLGEQIARNLLIDLRSGKKKHPTGALLSFVPTMSVGLSPALEAVVQRVSSHFAANRHQEYQRSLWD